MKLQKEEGQVRVTGLYFLKKKLPKGQAPKMSSFKSVTTIQGLRRCLKNDKKLYVRSIPDGVLKIEAKRRRIKRENGVERILSSYEQLLEKNKELSNSFAKLNLEFQEFRSLQEKLQGDSAPPKITEIKVEMFDKSTNTDDQISEKEKAPEGPAAKRNASRKKNKKKDSKMTEPPSKVRQNVDTATAKQLKPEQEQMSTSKEKKAPFPPKKVKTETPNRLTGIEFERTFSLTERQLSLLNNNKSKSKSNAMPNQHQSKPTA